VPIAQFSQEKYHFGKERFGQAWCTIGRMLKENKKEDCVTHLRGRGVFEVEMVNETT
jgi:hypothetical protein